MYPKPTRNHRSMGEIQSKKEARMTQRGSKTPFSIPAAASMPQPGCSKWQGPPGLNCQGAHSRPSGNGPQSGPSSALGPPSGIICAPDADQVAPRTVQMDVKVTQLWI